MIGIADQEAISLPVGPEGVLLEDNSGGPSTIRERTLQPCSKPWATQFISLQHISTLLSLFSVNLAFFFTVRVFLFDSRIGVLHYMLGGFAFLFPFGKCLEDKSRKEKVDTPTLCTVYISEEVCSRQVSRRQRFFFFLLRVVKLLIWWNLGSCFDTTLYDCMILRFWIPPAYFITFLFPGRFLGQIGHTLGKRIS